MRNISKTRKSHRKNKSRKLHRKLHRKNKSRKTLWGGAAQQEAQQGTAQQDYGQYKLDKTIDEIYSEYSNNKDPKVLPIIYYTTDDRFTRPYMQHRLTCYLLVNDQLYKGTLLAPFENMRFRIHDQNGDQTMIVLNLNEYEKYVLYKDPTVELPHPPPATSMSAWFAPRSALSSEHRSFGPSRD